MRQELLNLSKGYSGPQKLGVDARALPSTRYITYISIVFVSDIFRNIIITEHVISECYLCSSLMMNIENCYFCPQSEVIKVVVSWYVR